MQSYTFFSNFGRKYNPAQRPEPYVKRRAEYKGIKPQQCWRLNRTPTTGVGAKEQECNWFYIEYYFLNALMQSGQNISPESILTNCSSGESFLPQPSQLPLFPETARISV